MKSKVLLLLSLLVMSFSFGQTGKYWSVCEKRDGIEKAKGTYRSSFPTQFQLYYLDFNQLKAKLFTVVDSPNATCIITLPDSQGRMEDFMVSEASNFEADLQAQFPEIRAFSGRSLSNKSSYLKLSISPQGIQTVTFKADAPSEFIEPYSADGLVYVSYNKSQTPSIAGWRCDVDETSGVVAVSEHLRNGNSLLANNGFLKTMRLAQSCTAEYSNYFGATSAANVALVLAAFNNTMTRANGVYEKDLGIHLNIIAESTNVIYYNAATDPYSVPATGTNPANSNNANGWNIQLQNTLSSSLTGPSTALAANNAAYDIGHLFGDSGGGGNAGCIGCVCTNDTASTTDKNKGSGYTSPGDGVPQGDNFDIDYVVHEVGHQLGANHTFTHANEGSGVNVEVGSGVTIMGYAGITSYNAAAHSIDTYHALSIGQIQTNMNSKTCPVSTSLTGVNATPVASAGSDYTIPRSTPFMLTGSATDANSGDVLTYSWEQINVDTNGTYAGASSPASATKAGGPNWISLLPSTSPVRYFPRLSSIFNGSTTTSSSIVIEALSSVSRALNFRLTVRDNSPFVASTSVGQTAFDDAVVVVDATKGPLTVTSQNTTGISYATGSTQTVTWTVNNTNTITGGANVDILLTTDNGATWTTLLAGTPNDGSADVVMPSTPAVFCRLMVKASGNIFFNVNTKDFSVGYTITTTCNTYNGASMPIVTAAGVPANQIGTVNVPVTGQISSVSVFNNLTHTYLSDVITDISSPVNPATFVKVYNRSCGSTSGSLNLKFTDSGAAINCAAGGTTLQTVAPGESLSAFNGQNPQGTWTLRVYDNFTGDDGTLNSWSIEVCTQQISLTTESFGLDSFTLSPNPNNGVFDVKFNATSDDVAIMVHDIRGREIFKKGYTANGAFNETVDLSHVQSGVYMVTVTDGAKKEVKKVVIN